MGFVRCGRGLHYYDEQKYGECPYCGIFEEDSVTIAKMPEQKMHSDDVNTVYKSSISDDVKTEARISKNNGNDYVAGWLVCTEGKDKGRDYRIYHGRNFLGRDYSMDICIENDPAISRKNHCAIIYDSLNNKFYLSAMENIVYLDDEMTDGAVPLESGQEIRIGNSKLTFIPFCEGERKWEKE